MNSEEYINRANFRAQSVIERKEYLTKTIADELGVYNYLIGTNKLKAATIVANNITKLEEFLKVFNQNEGDLR